MTDYGLVLAVKYPNDSWSLNGDDYDGLDWRSDNPQPSRADLDAAWPEVQAMRDQSLVDGLRRVAYMNESDPLFFKWQRGAGTEQEWLAKVDEIRNRFPDPA